MGPLSARAEFLVIDIDSGAGVSNATMQHLNSGQPKLH